jgi:hypothetical protein
MKNARAVLNFAKLSDGNLEAVALSIIDHMSDNDNFPTPTPTIADVTAAVTEYTNALSAAKNRGKAEVELKNIKKNAMIPVLVSLAGYVTFVANGNRNIIATSGFSITKDGKTPQTMAVPVKFTVSAGLTTGEAISTVAGVKGVKKYVHQYTTDPLTPTSVWTSVYVSKRSYTFTGLDSGKKYWFRVAALGKGDQIKYTDPVGLIIQ